MAALEFDKKTWRLLGVAETSEGVAVDMNISSFKLLLPRAYYYKHDDQYIISVKALNASGKWHPKFHITPGSTTASAERALQEWLKNDKYVLSNKIQKSYTVEEVHGVVDEEKLEFSDFGIASREVQDELRNRLNAKYHREALMPGGTVESQSQTDKSVADEGGITRAGRSTEKVDDSDGLTPEEAWCIVSCKARSKRTKPLPLGCTMN